VLFYFGVQARGYGDVCGVKLGLDPGADRAECIERLSARELDVFALQIAGCDVVDARVAEDIVQRIIIFGQLSRQASNHHSQLALVFDLLRRRREFNFIVGTDYC
jgi:hypothetical protein